MTDAKTTQPGPTPPVIIVNIERKTYGHDHPGDRLPPGYRRSAMGQRAAAMKGYRYDAFAWLNMFVEDGAK